MRLYLSFIAALLFILSVDSRAQTLEVIAGCDNNFSDYSYTIAVDEAEQCTYIAGSFEISAGETINASDFFNINSIQGNVNQIVASSAVAQGGEDFFVAKVGFDGLIQWFVTGGGSDDDAILDVIIGSDGNVYLTGHISFPSIIYHTAGPANSIPGTFDDKLNAFVLSINPEGEFRWIERLGSDDDNSGLELKDGLNGLAVAGVFFNSSDSEDDSAGGIEIFGLEGPDADDDWRGAYIAYLDYFGQCQWYRAYTSPSFSYDLDEAYKIAASVDCDRENYYLATILSGDSFYRCYSYENGVPSNNGPQTLPNGTSVVVFKVTPEGTLDWSRTETIPNGSTITSGPYISVSCDNVYIATTVTSSASTPLTLVNYNEIPAGSLPSILFQQRSTTSGASQLVRLFPAGTDAENTYLTTIESDVQSRVYLAGSFNGQITFDQLNPNANLISEAQGKNAWIKAMTATTEHIWSSSFNGNQDDEITDLYLRGLSLVYFAGFSSSQNGLGLTPFGGSDPSGIFGKYSQSVSTGLSDFALQCPSTLSLNSNTECGLENYSFTEVQVINPCVVQFRENDAPSVLPFGNTVVTFEAVGYNGNTQQCTTSVFVQDVSLENEILCVPEIFRNTDENSCFATVSIMNPVISGNCAPVTVTNNFNNTSNITDATFPVGTTTVVWTAFFTDEDDDGEGGLVPMTCNTKVHVSDITAPTMACVNGLTLPLTSEGMIGITVDQIDAGSFDVCDIVERTISKTEFDCSNIGPNEVLLTAVDSHGNSNSCTATVTVVDEIIPTAQCKNIEVQLNTSGTASVNPDQINFNSFDNCSISSFNLSTTSFDCSDLGDNDIILTVTDESGLQSMCTATVLVIDLGSPPFVEAGNDITICANSSEINLSPTVGKDVVSVEWSGGQGNFSNGIASANNTYTPTTDEIQSGSVTLTITAFGNSVCGSTSDNLVITFSEAPTVFAGSDQQVCSDQVAVLNGAIAANNTSIQWSGGEGTFSPASDILQPNYTPSVEEFQNGIVTLTITAQGETGCESVSDQITLILAKKPLADAGLDQNLCGNIVNLEANIPSIGQGTWTASQEVSFTPDNQQPDATAMVTSFGSVTFTWTVVNAFCTSVDEAVMVFSVPPTAFAGEDQEVCSDQLVVLNGATATNQTAIQWTGGTGLFTPSADILQPSYTPTLEEFESGSVTLTITVQGGPSCEPASDQIIIALAKKPLAEAGPDQEVCGVNAQLAGNFPASGTGTWSTNQDVTFTPNANQALAEVTANGFGVATFTWTVINSFCSSSDEVVIEFFESPVSIEAGPDQLISFLGETTLSAESTTIGQGVWTTNNSSIIFDDKEDPKTNVGGLVPGQNILYWVVTNGPCSAVQDSVIITVEGLVIPTGFSPNGDNINDTFEIKGIASFESVSIKVLNRWGEEVFASENYKNDWNGLSKSGSELPNDTYYCVIESPILEKTHTGYIIINR